MHVIETNNLSRHFGSIKAVNGLNLMVPRGIIFGFLGPNGAGKTTTINLLLGLLEPTGGSANVFLGMTSKRDLPTFVVMLVFYSRNLVFMSV
jgi:ABC-2 type transport system ATP-binding protein